MFRRLHRLKPVPRARFEAEMDAELRGHLEAYTQDLISRGVPRPEAERQARREFGAVEAVKDECRESKGLAWSDALAREVRFGFRTLRKSPAFALTAIATLALCIGANTAIFSVVDAVLFRPLPFPEPDRLQLVATMGRSREGQFEQTSQNGRRWEYLRDNLRTMDVAVYSSSSQGVNLAPPGAGAQYVKQQRVSAGFFRVLGVSPLFGREIQPDEDRPGGPAVAVLSHSLWTRVFAADSSIVGRKILLRGEPYTVIGVMPRGFTSIPPAELWTPLRPSTIGEGGGANYVVLARIRAGVRRQDADAELATLSASYFSAIRLRPGVSVWLSLIPVQRGLADLIRKPLLLLWGAVGLVLLIGCVNVASLQLARAGMRRHEIATRLALGGARGAILRQLLVESFLVAVAGGTAGLALGYVLLETSKRMLAALGLTQSFSIDLRVMTVTAVAALATTLLFGLYPGLEATRLDVRTALASAGRTASAFRRVWARRALVVSEVALGMVLLVGAGLVTRTLVYLTGLNPGYDGRGVLTANLSLQDARYAASAQVNRLFDESLAKIREYPGVQAAGIALTLPYERALNEQVRVLDGLHPTQDAETTNVTYVTPGYFEALGIARLRGRGLENRDTETAQPVAVVNNAFLRRYLRDPDPLGKHLAFGLADSKPTVEIVGVVADVQERRGGWGDFGPITTVPEIYIPAAQFGAGGFRMVHAWFNPKWVVRDAGPRPGIASMMQQAVAAVDPNLPFAEFQSMDEIRSAAFGLQRLETTLLGALAGLALLLAAVGIYGLIAHSVLERTREFGIRLALGSSRWQAIASAARSGILLAATGVAAGLLLSLWAGRLLRALIWGVKPDDGLTLGTVAATLLTVAALAALLPALRIARIDPAVILREE